MRKTTTLPIIVVFALVGCSDALPKGEVYSSIDGSTVIRVQSPNEVDYRKSSIGSLVAEYTIEDDDRVRVVADVMGLRAVVYYTIAKEGLVSDDGTILYSTKHIDQARDNYYCEELRQNLADFTRKQAAYFDRKEQYLTEGDGSGVHFKPTRISRIITGVPQEYFAVLTTHERCSKSYVFSGSDGEEQFLDKAEAQALFQEISRAATERRQQIEERIRRFREEQAASVKRRSENGVQIIEFLAYPEIWSKPITLPRNYKRFEWTKEDEMKFTMRVAGRRIYGPEDLQENLSIHGGSELEFMSLSGEPGKLILKIMF